MALALQWDQSLMAADLVIGDGGLQTDDGLEAAVILSLFLDAEASDDDDLPAGADRRGYWADALATEARVRTGSKIWIAIQKGKRTGRTLQLVREYAQDALRWMTDEGIADLVEVSTEFDKEEGFLALGVVVHGPANESNPWRKIWRLRLGI